MIRGYKKPCPFGLNIPTDCLSIGSEILNLEPKEAGSHNPELKSENSSLPGCNACLYAKAIYMNRGLVDCSFNDAPVDVTIGGSPHYPNIYVGTQQPPASSMNYLSSLYDDSSFHDNNLHNGYLGLFSFYGSH